MFYQNNITKLDNYICTLFLIQRLIYLQEYLLMTDQNCSL